jgi:hypothetical protein
LSHVTWSMRLVMTLTRRLTGLTRTRQAYREASRLAAEVEAAAVPGGAEARWGLRAGERRGSGLAGLDAANDAAVEATAGWGDVWPEWGDEVDGEMARLRRMSFTAWSVLGGVATPADFGWALASACTRERLRRANEALYRHRRELEQLEGLLDGIAAYGRASAD